MDNYLGVLCRRFSETDPSQHAFYIYDGKVQTNITYSEFLQDILRVGGYFKNHKITGQHIALISPSDYSLFVLFFAATITGNVSVILNAGLPVEMLKQQCQKADVTLICAPSFISESLQADSTKLMVLDFDEMRSCNPMLLEDIAYKSKDETIMLMFTSGTTGKSKAVEITSGNLYSSAQSTNALYDLPGMEQAYHAIPR